MANPRPTGSGKILEAAKEAGLEPAQYVAEMLARYGRQEVSHRLLCSVEALRYWLKKAQKEKEKEAKQE